MSATQCAGFCQPSSSPRSHGSNLVCRLYFGGGLRPVGWLQSASAGRGTAMGRAVDHVRWRYRSAPPRGRVSVGNLRRRDSASQLGEGALSQAECLFFFLSTRRHTIVCLRALMNDWPDRETIPRAARLRRRAQVLRRRTRELSSRRRAPVPRPRGPRPRCVATREPSRTRHLLRGIESPSPRLAGRRGARRSKTGVAEPPEPMSSSHSRRQAGRYRTVEAARREARSSCRFLQVLAGPAESGHLRAVHRDVRPRRKGSHRSSESRSRVSLRALRCDPVVEPRRPQFGRGAQNFLGGQGTGSPERSAC